ncbi:MAG: hypothetical protein KDK45_00150 [Leptospiraceae bacterium]|nr:hypothetical protein [Leptospiraceae bacterium]
MKIQLEKDKLYEVRVCLDGKEYCFRFMFLNHPGESGENNFTVKVEFFPGGSGNGEEEENMTSVLKEKSRRNRKRRFSEEGFSESSALWGFMEKP